VTDTELSRKIAKCLEIKTTSFCGVLHSVSETGCAPLDFVKDPAMTVMLMKLMADKDEIFFVHLHEHVNELQHDWIPDESGNHPPMKPLSEHVQRAVAELFALEHGIILPK